MGAEFKMSPQDKRSNRSAPRDSDALVTMPDFALEFRPRGVTRRTGMRIHAAAPRGVTSQYHTYAPELAHVLAEHRNSCGNARSMR